jgi:hypothetical protein
LSGFPKQGAAGGGEEEAGDGAGERPAGGREEEVRGVQEAVQARAHDGEESGRILIVKIKFQINELKAHHSLGFWCIRPLFEPKMDSCQIQKKY